MKKRLKKGWLLLIILIFVFQFMRINEVWGQATHKIEERQRISALMGMAQTYQTMGEYEDAIKTYQIILDEDNKVYPRECIQAQCGIAQIYQYMGRYEEAIKTYQLVLDEYKDYPGESLSAQLGIASVYRAMGKFDEAIKIYNEILYKDEAKE